MDGTGEEAYRRPKLPSTRVENFAPNMIPLRPNNATCALFLEVIWRKLWQRREQEAVTLSADATRNQWAEKLRILRGTRRVLNPNGKMLSPRRQSRVVVGDQLGL